MYFSVNPYAKKCGLGDNKLAVQGENIFFLRVLHKILTIENFLLGARLISWCENRNFVYFFSRINSENPQKTSRYTVKRSDDKKTDTRNELSAKFGVSEKFFDAATIFYGDVEHFCELTIAFRKISEAR